MALFRRVFLSRILSRRVCGATSLLAVSLVMSVSRVGLFMVLWYAMYGGGGGGLGHVC